MTTIAILLGKAVSTGKLDVTGGELEDLQLVSGTGTTENGTFSSAGSAGRLHASIDGRGAILRLTADDIAFSVRIADLLDARWPVLIDDLSIALTTEDDARSYENVRRSIDENMSGALTALERIDGEDEESFTAAAAATRDLKGPIWLGLSRDMRFFIANMRGAGAEEPREYLWDWIQPVSHAEHLVIEESEGQSVRYQFLVGRGLAASEQITRGLIDGESPVLTARIAEGDMLYELTSFTGLEGGELDEVSIKGTHFLLADGHARGHMFTTEQQAEYDRLLADTDPAADQPVHFTRVTATNTGNVPRYAFFKAPVPDTGVRHSRPVPHEFDGKSGFARYGVDRVYCINRHDGEPLARPDLSVLVAPGSSTTIEFRVPHRPVSAERAQRLAARDFGRALAGCLSYWKGKRAPAARFKVPERRIDEMVRAGLHHLEIAMFGAEPEGPLCPTVGIYSAIGSESSPIIQFLDSAGLHKTAERCLDYFLEKQHDDGFIQNFFGYMLETEAVLWSLGEHFRYTRDEGWLSRILPKLKLAYGYVLTKRRQRLDEASRSGGYGLLAGKTADPEDPFESFMLNGYAYLGLSRAAEMLEHIGDREAQPVRNEAEQLRGDIRRAFIESMEASPVVPLGDGRWCRTAPPWTGARGPLCLDPTVTSFYTHAAVTTRDSLLGPLWLAAQEVLDPDEPMVGSLLEYHADLFHDRNAALTQPYYSPHPWLHLKRGETKRFLKAYYNNMAGLADRETYSFWEHYHHASTHKTHEEGWFLMHTRWMLYMEEGDELQLFKGIPRRWLRPNARIEIEGAASYFGPFDVRVEVDATGNRMRVSFQGDSERGAGRVSLRLPHPDRRRALGANKGTYHAATETLHVSAGSFETELSF